MTDIYIIGHATRAVKVIDYLLNAKINVHVVCGIEISYFEHALGLNPYFNSHFYHHKRILDAGAIQLNPLAVDAIASLKRYYNTVHCQHDEILRQETEFLLSYNIRLVIADATAIACNAGKKANCKVILLTNFTWDVIYKHMMSYDLQLDNNDILNYINMINKCEKDYCYADLYIQLPCTIDVPCGYNPTNVYHAPLLGREYQTSSNTMKQSLNIPFDTKIILLGFGGHAATWSFLTDTCIPADEVNGNKWLCLVLGATSENMPSSRFISIDFLSYIPDYIAMADVVIGKLGYGFVSECIINRTPLVYIKRSYWPEEQPLETYMLNHSPDIALNMPIEDFEIGNWHSYIHQAIQYKEIIQKYDIDNNVDQPSIKASSALNDIGAKILSCL
jgi:L-arabinokinase